MKLPVKLVKQEMKPAERMRKWPWPIVRHNTGKSFEKMRTAMKPGIWNEARSKDRSNTRKSQQLQSGVPQTDSE